MNCKKCGSPLAEGDQFCKNCGATVNAQEDQIGVQQPINNQENQNNVQQLINNQENQSSVQSINNQPNQMQQPIDNQQQMTNMQQNYSNNSQNSWQNNYNPTPNFQQPKSNGKGKYIIIGVAVVVVIFAVIFGISMLGNARTYTPPTEVITNNSTYSVKFQDFTFKIPTNLIYDTDSDTLYIGDEDDTWVAELIITDGSFNQVKNNKSMLQSYFQQNGFTSNPAEVKSLGGSEFVTLELSKSGVNFVGAYAKLNSMKMTWMIALNQDNSYDYDILKNISSIISTATYTDASNSIATTPKFNFNITELSEFAQ